MVNFFLLLSKLCLAADCALIFFFNASHSSAPLPQSCSSQSVPAPGLSQGEDFAFVFAELQEVAARMWSHGSPSQPFLEQNSDSIANEGLPLSAAKPLGPIFEFREKY